MPKTKTVRVNIRATANVAEARTVNRNGRDHIIVPAATLPDDVVMNRIKYPADEIAASFRTLERTPAPFGHPIFNGKFLSARDPEGINLGYFGAWNENVRRENGRVFMDKVIDVEYAKRSDHGRAVLNAIDKREPIHTSTGLFLDLEEADNEDFDYIARNMRFDHDAVLIGEEGAATPADGVGIFVNSAGERDEIEVINSSLEDELDWAARSALRAARDQEDAPILARIKQAILDAVKGETSQDNSRKGADMPEEKTVEALSAKVDTLETAVNSLDDKIGKAVEAAVKPLVDNLAEMKANQKAKDDAEKAEYVKVIVAANLMSEAAAGELTLNAARELAEKAKPGTAAAMNGGGRPNGSAEDEFADVSLNAGIDAVTGKEAEAH